MIANKYRKKPVVIDAIQLSWANWNSVCDFISKDAFGGGVYLNESLNVVEISTDKIGLHINTLDGRMLAVEGDYIIKGIQGEFYPCKPDIFEATYEVIE